jgi:hypothetical protein
MRKPEETDESLESLRFSAESMISRKRIYTSDFQSISSPDQSRKSDREDPGVTDIVQELKVRIERLEEDLFDSLNSLTDRINELDDRLIDSVSKLKQDQTSDYESQRRTLAEVARRILGFLRTTLLRPRRLISQPAQSRTAMCPVITSARE